MRKIEPAAQILEARELLYAPFAQDGLHRALRRQAEDLAVLAGERDRRLAVGDFHLRGERGLRPVQQGCEHLPHRIVVAVDRLLPDDHQVRALFGDQRLEHLGHGAMNGGGAFNLAQMIEHELGRDPVGRDDAAALAEPGGAGGAGAGSVCG